MFSIRIIWVWKLDEKEGKRFGEKEELGEEGKEKGEMMKNQS